MTEANERAQQKEQADGPDVSAGYGWHLFEIAAALYFIREDPHYAVARDALIAGYREYRPLPDRVVEKLPVLMTPRDGDSGCLLPHWLKQGRQGSVWIIPGRSARCRTGTAQQGSQARGDQAGDDNSF